MKLQKKYLNLFYKVLSECNSLSLAEARVRDYFMKTLVEQTQTFEKEKRAIFDIYGDKDEEGKILPTEAGTYSFNQLTDEKIGEFNNEVNTLFNEEVSMVGMEKIADILEKTDYKPLKGEAVDIDYIISCIKGVPSPYGGESEDKTEETTDTKTEESSNGDSEEPAIA